MPLNIQPRAPLMCCKQELRPKYSADYENGIHYTRWTIFCSKCGCFYSERGTCAEAIDRWPEHLAKHQEERKRDKELGI